MQVEPYYEFILVLKSQSVLRAEKIIICKTFVRPMATYGAESRTFSKYTAKRMADFERKILSRKFGGIEVNENWRKRYSCSCLEI
jgi:hypothetical protein